MTENYRDKGSYLPQSPGQTNHLLTLLALCIICSATASSSFAQDARITGSFVNFTGIGIRPDPGPQRVIVQRDQFNLIAEAYEGDFKWLVELEMTSDLGFFGKKEISNAAFFEQAFVQYDTDKVNASIGLQETPWGFSNGIFVLDVLSNFDLREALTRNYKDIRFSVWSANISLYPSGGLRVDFFLSPGDNPARIPDPDSPFGTGSLFRDLNFDLDFLDDDRMKRDYSDPEFATRIGFTSDIWDGSISYIDSFSRLPSFRLAVVETESAQIQATYYKRKLLGGNFTTSAFDPFIVGGEIAYNTKHLLPLDPFSSASLEGSLIEKPLVQSVISVNHSNSFFDILLGFSIRIILDYEPEIASNENQFGLTALLSRSFLDERLRLEMNLLSPDFEQHWAMIGAHYSLTDKVALFSGFQFYGGDTANSDLSFPLALYGQRDLVFFQMGYEF